METSTSCFGLILSGINDKRCIVKACLVASHCIEAELEARLTVELIVNLEHRLSVHMSGPDGTGCSRSLDEVGCS